MSVHVGNSSFDARPLSWHWPAAGGAWDVVEPDGQSVEWPIVVSDGHTTTVVKIHTSSPPAHVSVRMFDRVDSDGVPLEQPGKLIECGPEMKDCSLKRGREFTELTLLVPSSRPVYVVVFAAWIPLRGDSAVGFEDINASWNFKLVVGGVDGGTLG